MANRKLRDHFGDIHVDLREVLGINLKEISNEALIVKKLASDINLKKSA